MIRSLLLASAMTVVAGAAFAADLPDTKGAPVYAPPLIPVFSWTGFYIGANAGVSGTSSSSNTSYTNAETWSYHGNGWGFSGGGQIGYNYEFANTNFVAGVEADFQGSTAKSTYWDDNYSYSNNYNESYKYKTSLDWWGTARVRLGYAFGNILPYVTGGFAYGRTNTAYSYQYNNNDNYNYSYGATRTGWTVGAGVEYAITKNLTLKVEGLYTDLGNKTVDTDYYGNNNSNTYTQTNVRFATVRAGVNWKFDFLAPPAPVVAKY
jgi:outer membrane immunogenic protein